MYLSNRKGSVNMIKYDLENDMEYLDANTVVCDNDVMSGFGYRDLDLDMETIREMAEKECSDCLTGEDDEDSEMIDETIDEMITIGRIRKNSLLGQCLRAYAKDPTTNYALSDMRSMVELSDAYYTVHGCGYDLFNQDILNGGSFEFYEWLQSHVTELYVSFM